MSTLRPFGQHPTRNAALILAAVFWPIVAFWPDVRLDPARFVEEWVKLGVAGVLLHFLLESARERASALSRRLQHDNIVTHQLIAPLSAVRDEIESFSSCAGDRDHLQRLRVGWSDLIARMTIIADSLATDGPAGDTAFGCLRELNVERCNALIDSLLRSQSGAEPLSIEVTELKERVSKSLEFGKNRLETHAPRIQ